MQVQYVRHSPTPTCLKLDIYVLAAVVDVRSQHGIQALRYGKLQDLIATRAKVLLGMSCDGISYGHTNPL